MAWGAIARGIAVVGRSAATGAGRVAAGTGMRAAQAARAGGATRMASARAGAEAGSKAFGRAFKKRAALYAQKAVRDGARKAVSQGTPKFARNFLGQLNRISRTASEEATRDMGGELVFDSGVAAEEIYVSEIRAQIRSMNLEASGDLYNSVWAVYGTSSEAVLTTSQGYSVGSTPYARFIEYGRKAGKMPPVEAIYKWMQDKGYNPTMQDAYAVAKHIARNGIAAKNPFSEGAKSAEAKMAAQSVNDLAKRVNSLFSQ